MEKQVTVTVEDTAGKKWKLTRTGEGVKVEPPFGWGYKPIPFAALQYALDELKDPAEMLER